MSVDRINKNLRAALFSRCEPVVAAIASLRGVTPAGIRGRRRMGYLVSARHEVWAQLWMYGMPYLSIAHAFGVDHTSVIHGVRKCLGDERFQAERLARLARKRVAS